MEMQSREAAKIRCAVASGPKRRSAVDPLCEWKIERASRHALLPCQDAHQNCHCAWPAISDRGSQEYSRNVPQLGVVR